MSSDLFSVRGKCAAVTGAASGLGREMVEVLVEHGARVAMIDRDEAALAEAAKRFGDSVLPFTADVRDKTVLESAINAAHQQLGALDIVIANAGITDRKPALLHEIDDQTWNDVIDTNLQGVFYTARASLRHMVAQRSGKLIIVASMFGIAAPAGLFPRPATAASKGATINLTRELALQYASHNIQINALCPGFFRTATRPRNAENAKIMADYTPMGRIAEAHEIKGSVLYLASTASDFVTGTTLVVDGGVLAR
jgi:NAD(P)-dependent dehydrogenase (short-subunit alcohol dehydrogenase family)